MEADVKKEAKRQYLSYFKIWFILAGVLLVIAVILGSRLFFATGGERSNLLAPSQRVYDQAEVLTAQEEADLEAYIAKAEKLCCCDIVVVTISAPVEGEEIVGMGYRYDDWEWNMRDLADDFFDNNNFGYHTSYKADGVEGDGVLLLDNWYEGQAGSWLSTSGKVMEKMGSYEIDEVLDEVYSYVETNPYRAYVAYVDGIIDVMSPLNVMMHFAEMIPFSVLISLIAAIVFVVVKLRNKEGEVSVSCETYKKGSVDYNRKEDVFIRKHVSKRRIPKNTSSGGGGGSHSSGGAHRSSSGASHGGGGRRR